LVRKKYPKIAVIGHIVWDKIIWPDGQVVEDFGGTAYNLAALSSLVDDFATVYPVCLIGKDLAGRFHDHFGQLPGIDLSLVKTINQHHETHILTYDSSGYRKENNRHPMPMLFRALFGNCPNIDIALVNYIGGDEFPPRLLRWLKDAFRPLIYMDFHSLALGRTAKNYRFFRYHSHWRAYTSLADIVQMNYFELKTLFANIENMPSQIMTAAKTVLATGPKAVIVTRESDNLIVVWRQNRKVLSRALPVPAVKKAVDQTGCGDSFAAGFVYSFLKQRKILRACNSGLRLAAQKLTFSGITGFIEKI